MILTYPSYPPARVKYSTADSDRELPIYMHNLVLNQVLPDWYHVPWIYRSTSIWKFCCTHEVSQALSQFLLSYPLSGHDRTSKMQVHLPVNLCIANKISSLITFLQSALQGYFGRSLDLSDIFGMPTIWCKKGITRCDCSKFSCELNLLQTKFG